MRRRTSRIARPANVSATAATDRGSARHAGAPATRLTGIFAAAMAAAGPFEPDAVLAVGVSGGADSMALAMLADEWARRHGGRIAALTVDHGLRPGSAAEARLVGRRLATHGIAHQILRWRGAKPAAGIQAAARAARYELLTGWCRRHRVLHLLTAHQADDQAETVAMRAAHGSGEAGLAAMPLVGERDGVRLLRPLLGVRHRALCALLKARGIGWVEDPSNEDARFERIRLRRSLTAAGEATIGRAIARAAAMGARRAKREDAVADLLAAAKPMPEGWLLLPAELFARGAAAVARSALERCLLCVGGADYPPRTERLDRLLGELRRPGRFAGRTLAGCRIFDWRGCLVICREAAAIEPSVAAGQRVRLHWDQRFGLRPSAARSGHAIRPLGSAGPRPAELSRAARARDLPGPVLASLPALCDRLGRPVSVPHLGWRRAGTAATLALTGWRPRHALAPARFLPAGESCFNGVADYLE